MTYQLGTMMPQKEREESIPSIERTPNSPLRGLSVAAHVKRSVARWHATPMAACNPSRH